MAVNDVEGGVGDGSADGNRPVCLGDCVGGGPDGGFGGAVHVDELAVSGQVVEGLGWQ